MFINSLLLAISSSIDSLGIGITYGIKNTNISYCGKIILFLIALLISFISLAFGNVIINGLPSLFSKLLGSFILILLGSFIIFQAINNNTQKSHKLQSNSCEKVYSFFIKFLGITIKIIKNPISSDLDNSKTIDAKESLFLSLALSLDSFGIGICGSMIGINLYILPLLIAIFQLFFLNIGTILGKKLYKLSNLPHNVWSFISGLILILIGIFKLLF